MKRRSWFKADHGGIWTRRMDVRLSVRTYGCWVAGRLAVSCRRPAGSFSQQQYPPGWVYPLQQQQQQHPLAPASGYCTRRDLPGIHIAAKGIEPLGLGNFARRIYLVVSGGTRKKHPSIKERRVRLRSTFGLLGEALSQLSCRQHNTLHPLTIPESNKCRTSRRSVLVGPAMVAN